jgi:hypothetical protein
MESKWFSIIKMSKAMKVSFVKCPNESFALS